MKTVVFGQQEAKVIRRADTVLPYCAEGEHDGCLGWFADNATRGWEAQIILCSCGCHIEPWPFPCAENLTLA